MASTSVVFDIIAHDRASDKFNKLGSSADNSSSKMSKLGSVMKGAAKAGAIGLGIAVVAVGKGLWEAGQAAIEDEKSQALLANTLKRTTGATDKQIASVEDWISKQGELLGVTDDDLRPALQRLSEATGDVREAQELASLAMDVSAGTGKSLKTVSEALMKAQNGQVSGLSRLGIETKDAEGKTLTFEQATKKMADTFDGAASTAADTTAGKMGRLKVMFDETKEAIGARLIPVVTQLVDWFMDKALPAIKDTYAELKDRFGPTIQELAGWFTDKLIPAVKDIAGQLKDTFLPIIEAVASWVMDKLVPAVKGFAEDALPAARDMIGHVRDALSNAQPFFELLGNIIVDVLIPFLGKLAKTVLPLLGDALETVGTALGAVGDMGKWMWNNALQPVFKFIVEAIGKVLQWFGKMLQLIGKAPKMGWVGDLGDKLVNAGGKAEDLGDDIRDIPDAHPKVILDDSQARHTLAELRAIFSGLVYDMNHVGDGVRAPRTATGPTTAGGLTSPRMAARTARSGGDGEAIQVNLYVDGKVLHQALVKRKRTLGRPLGLA